MIGQVLAVSTAQDQSGDSPIGELPEDLELAADILLGPFLIAGSDSGIYTEIQLVRKMRNERKRLPVIEEHGISQETADYLADRQIEELIDVAGLSPLQEIVYRFYIAGFNVRRTAARLGLKNRTLNERLKTVKRKITAAYREGRYAGWYEVYLSEVNRPAYRRR